MVHTDALGSGICSDDLAVCTVYCYWSQASLGLPEIIIVGILLLCISGDTVAQQISQTQL